ncbi:MAG TPA: hypothetical protein EYN60_01520 [Nitrospirales bacterium]|nr:hypothetical protein [Nitrospirales bacterium]HIA14611.1 hypothetical protein [Nitrospirales bacterium]HIC04565.1 hypothetical protein [Nitrospirales bacterium]HIN33245.1 hypothetical protein [Nitrospirales bacterium]
MTFDLFKATLVDDAPPAEIDPVLRALWLEARGDWDGAHKIIQDSSDRSAAWVHAYLHRKEGDLTNAAYWYSRAGRDVSSFSLDGEWEEVVKTLLADLA